MFDDGLPDFAVHSTASFADNHLIGVSVQLDIAQATWVAFLLDPLDRSLQLRPHLHKSLLVHTSVEHDKIK